MDVTSLLPLQGLAPVDALSIVPGDETILVEAVQFSDRVLVLMAGAGKIITKGMVGRVNGEVLDRVHIVLVSQFVEAGCGFLILFARKKRHCVLPFFCWQPRDRMTRGHWTFLKVLRWSRLAGSRLIHVSRHPVFSFSPPKCSQLTSCHT